MTANYITGFINTNVGQIPQVATRLSRSDYLGTMMVRWSINRNNYSVKPGLYAIGNPDVGSDVFVSANYKLSFDHLRKNLDGLNAWILVIDTKGINVWCAAGKGTFGTNELVFRIKETSLDKIVNHRRVIVPQLGAVGVSAHIVKEETGNPVRLAVQSTGSVFNPGTISFSGTEIRSNQGFSVKYGPVRAADIKDFIAAGYKTTAEMRRVNFTFMDRLILIPVELVMSIKYLLAAFIIVFILSAVNKNGINYEAGFFSLVLMACGYISGAGLTPVLLPWIPFRSFALKGFFVGLISTSMLLLSNFTSDNWYMILAWLLINTGTSSFLAMNFTGASTYTSLSGVKQEMKIAVPLQILFVLAGLIIMIILKFV